MSEINLNSVYLADFVNEVNNWPQNNIFEKEKMFHMMNQIREHARKNCNYSKRTNPDFPRPDNQTEERQYYIDETYDWSSQLVSTMKPVIICGNILSNGYPCRRRYDTDPKRSYQGFVFYLNVNKLIQYNYVKDCYCCVGSCQ